jgi:hypothetical protein
MERYMLAKQYANSVTDDFEFARAAPTIPYNPHDTGDIELRTANQSRYWTQGMTAGIAEAAAQALIAREAQQPVRVMRFGEFANSILLMSLGSSRLSPHSDTW